MNKTLTTILFLCGLISTVLAQVPQGFSYQAVARDSAGDCIADQMITIQMSVLDGSSTGTTIYQEQFGSVSTNASGLFSIVIGEGNPESPFTVADFEAIDWSEGSDRFLDVQIALDDNPNNLVQVGTTQLMSVPFALGAEKAIQAETADHALTSDAAAQADSADYAENGLKPGSNGDQEMIWNGANGSINGVLEGLSTTTYNNGRIRLFDDTSDELVRLTAAALGGGEDYGALTLYGNNGLSNMILGTFTSNGADRGAMTMRDDAGLTKAQMYVNGSNVGVFQSYGPNGQKNAEIGNSGTGNYGRMSVYDDNGDSKVSMWPEDAYNGAGRMILTGENGSTNIDFSVQSSTQTDGNNKGAIRMADQNGASRSIYTVNGAGGGYFDLRGPNSNINVILTNDTNPNHGYMAVRDAGGTTRVKLFVNNLGNGVLEATGPTGGIKNFVMPHPTKSDKEIAYVSLEGPEAAAYERGTTQLINGEAVIQFSEHFEIVANPQTMTVILTPRSPDAKGLAAFDYTATGFKVKELFQGKGNYAFDWEVKAVRKGWEDFKVIRDKSLEPDAIEDVE